jgi:hypothetical protein
MMNGGSGLLVTIGSKSAFSDFDFFEGDDEVQITKKHYVTIFSYNIL